MPPTPRRVALPYKPRSAFHAFHARKQRWACLVAHRRAGKTVAAVNDGVKLAIESVNTQGLANYAPHVSYIAPFRSQAKQIAWEYLKYYTRQIQKGPPNESDLYVELVTNARIRLFGADNADSLRGIGNDLVICDEYGDFRPSIWGNVIRPTLSDRMGRAIFMGTPKGKNQFWDIYDEARSNPAEWFCATVKASESKILPPEELAALKKQLSNDQYLQEYECSFEAAILGAYYGVEMRELGEAGHITDVAYDPSLPTYTAWDIGHRDDTAIWWYQVIRSEIHVIDFYSASGEDPESIAEIVNAKPYHYGQHFLPHDAKAKTFAASGKSTLEQLAALLGGIAMLSIVPDVGVQNGIQTARLTLPHCWIDAVRCKEGIEALRQYEREYDEDKKAFREKPKHNWTSHPADAFRMLAVSWREETPQRKVYPERALIVGPTNQATLEDMWAAHKRQAHDDRF